MEARRIRTVLFFMASIFLFSCQRKENNRLAMLALQTACKDQWAELEYINAHIEREVYLLGERRLDLRVLTQSKRIANWKKSAIPKLSASGLKQYADSLIFWNKFEGKTLLYGLNDPTHSFLSDIQSSRTEVPTKLNTQADSLHYYELLYLLMRKESELQSQLAARLLNEGLNFSSASKLKYKINDTVRIITKFRYYEVADLYYRVKSLEITHQSKPTNIVPSVEIIGKYVLLKFKAQQKGTYLVKGTITGTYPESKKEELNHIYQPIKVE